MKADYCFLNVHYNRKNITNLLTGDAMAWSYQDNLSGEIDSLEITLQDKENRWMHEWFPSKGSLISATRNYAADSGQVVADQLGKFEVDEITANGPASAVTIKALATSEKTSLRKEDKTKSWEKATIEMVAKDIAKRNGMKLVYKANETEKEDRIEQESKTDLAFLYELCQKESFCLKITSNSIIILDEADLERAKAVGTINRFPKENDKIKILNNGWSARSTLTNVYRKCIVKYKDTKAKSNIKGEFTPPKPPKTSRVLIVKEQAKTVAKANKLAKKKLREANKEANTMSMTVFSKSMLYAGQTYNMQGFGHFSGKYIITSCTSSNDCTFQLNLRRCLEGY